MNDRNRRFVFGSREVLSPSLTRCSAQCPPVCPLPQERSHEDDTGPKKEDAVDSPSGPPPAARLRRMPPIFQQSPVGREASPRAEQGQPRCVAILAPVEHPHEAETDGGVKGRDGSPVERLGRLFGCRHGRRSEDKRVGRTQIKDVIPSLTLNLPDYGQLGRMRCRIGPDARSARKPDHELPAVFSTLQIRHGVDNALDPVERRIVDKYLQRAASLEPH